MDATLSYIEINEFTITMLIECPSCSEENKVELGDDVVCKACNGSFSGYSYSKIAKPLISATTALCIGAFGALKIDKHFLEEQRYPVSVEYELIENCANADTWYSSYGQHAKKTQLCICALEKTMSDVSYKEMSESESTFVTHFRKNIATCG